MDPTIQQDLYNRLTSRKFLLTVVVFIFAFGGWLGGQLTYAEFMDIGWKVAAAFFGAEGAVDAFAMLRPKPVVNAPSADTVVVNNNTPSPTLPVPRNLPMNETI